MKIFITGTSRGLGQGIAHEYLKNGHEVFSIGRHPGNLLKENPAYHFKSIDLSSLESIHKNMAEFIPINAIDRVVLNAGVLNEIKDLKNTPVEEIKRVMDINVWANKILIDILIESQKEVKQIIAISSGASVSGARGWNAYSLSKASLNMLISLYSKENPTIHFCALAPGLIDTQMQDYIYSVKNEEDYPVIKKLKSLKGTESMPKPEKAARLVINSFEKAKKFESGSFLDVRKI